eukprot:gnl/MRDRNA2_/MRDRNA2_35639_c0_seq1.p1 gnl/MRDRNA2_/MRDRNA2_35639_c0~~gnl/MRDRNA2_/MRDRNA2_35639_c0_seq1.p1  ORF type:complete len:277 (+),score=65.43 gnl/MRDRNA2_/MRDRNA2_35639_c0_seq1:818-1648(+)
MAFIPIFTIVFVFFVIADDTCFWNHPVRSKVGRLSAMQQEYDAALSLLMDPSLRMTPSLVSGSDINSTSIIRPPLCEFVESAIEKFVESDDTTNSKKSDNKVVVPDHVSVTMDASLGSNGAVRKVPGEYTMNGLIVVPDEVHRSQPLEQAAAAMRRGLLAEGALHKAAAAAHSSLDPGTARRIDAHVSRLVSSASSSSFSPSRGGSPAPPPSLNLPPPSPGLVLDTSCTNEGQATSSSSSDDASKAILSVNGSTEQCMPVIPEGEMPVGWVEEFLD